MKTIYAVLKTEVWDGEDCNEDYGSFESIEDAKKQLKKVRDEIYPDWENERIEDDSDCHFYAYRDGWWVDYHVILCIMEMKLWEKNEIETIYEN